MQLPVNQMEDPNKTPTPPFYDSSGSSIEVPNMRIAKRTSGSVICSIPNRRLHKFEGLVKWNLKRSVFTFTLQILYHTISDTMREKKSSVHNSISPREGPLCKITQGRDQRFKRSFRETIHKYHGAM